MDLYGKYYPLSKYSGTRSDGTEYSGETPAGYGGLFRTHITDMKGNNLPHYSVNDYFLTLKNPDGNDYDHEDLNFETWEIVDAHISHILGNHMPPYDKDYHWQSGFGGDEGDGLLDFFCKERIEAPPPSIFRLYGKSYRMEWYYVGDDDECLPDCECDTCKHQPDDHEDGCDCNDCIYRDNSSKTD